MHPNTKILMSIISALLMLVLSGFGWWANRVQSNLDNVTKAVIELQTRTQYLYGNFQAAPIKTVLTAEEKK